MTRRLLIVAVVVAAVAAATSVAIGSASSMGVQPQKFTKLTRGDGYAPRLTTLQLFDVNANGRVDRVVATFSETLAAYSAGNAPWTVANVPSGGTLATNGVSVAGTQATLTLTEGVGAVDTTVGTMTVALAASATGIRDAAGNQASFTATAPADKAGPVPTTAGTQNNGGGGNSGRIQAGDTFFATFSEAILATSVPLTTTVTEADPAGAVTIDTLNIPGITNGAITTGGSAYVATDGGSAAFAASTAGVYLSTTVYVTVGPACLGTGCASLGRGNGAFVYVPATTLTDAAGNAAAGSWTAPAGTPLF